MKARMNSLLLRASSVDIEMLTQAQVSFHSLPYEAVEIDMNGTRLTRQDGKVMRATALPASRTIDSLLKNIAGRECGHFANPGRFSIEGKAECPICGIYQAWEIPEELFWQEIG